MTNIDKYKWPELIDFIPDEKEVCLETSRFRTKYWTQLTLENEKTRQAMKAEKR